MRQPVRTVAGVAIGVVISAISFGVLRFTGTELPLVVLLTLLASAPVASGITTLLPKQNGPVSDSANKPDLEGTVAGLRTMIDNIESAICTVDAAFRIGPDVNRRLPEIFGAATYVGKSIFDKIFYILQDDVKREMKEFVGVVLETTNASKDILNAAIPFTEFTYVYNEGGELIHKVIELSCDRIEINGHARVLFIFKDITVAREAEEETKRAESRYERQYELITALLSNDRDIVRRFMDDAQNTLDTLKATIRTLEINATNDAVIDRLIGITHTVKGESYSLGFASLAEAASSFEAFLKTRKGQAISIETQLQLIGQFESLWFQIDLFTKVSETLKSYAGTASEGAPITTAESLRTALTAVATTTAREEGKEVDFELSTDLVSLPERVFAGVKEAALHLIRNSLAHGIETPSERVAVGKPEKGAVRLTIDRNDRDWEVAFADDGRGLDLDAIVSRAVQLGMVPAGAADKLSDGQKISCLFRDGFSTREQGDMVAGTGAGMSVVRRVFVSDLGGKMIMGKPGRRGFSIRFRFPAESTE